LRPVLRRSLIALAAAGALAGGSYWWLGREATLQGLVQKLADASGGNVAVSGVSGSLFGAMHFGQVRFRADAATVTIDNADVNWSPLQLFSGGIEISSLRAASVTVETHPSKEPSHMPDSLAPPFPISIGEARIDRLLVASSERRDVIKTLRLSLRGNGQQWQLKDASAATQWGVLVAGGKVDTHKPFKLLADATLAGPRATPAAPNETQLRVHASGDLATLNVGVDGKAHGAGGNAKVVLAPFEPMPLRSAMAHVDLPAKLQLDVNALVDAQEAIKGSIKLVNPAPPGPVDKQLLPLRSATAAVGGTLSSIELSELLIDLGQAGTVKGSGSLSLPKNLAQFALRAERIDLKALHTSLRTTHIGGDIKLTGNEKAQSLVVQLAQDGLRLAARAHIKDRLVQLEQARLQAGTSIVDLTANASLDGPFKLRAKLQDLNPASLGAFPEADINASANASGTLSAAWAVAADFALAKSRIGKHPLSGEGSFLLDAKRFSKVNATLALAQNKVELKGSFGGPGEELKWRVDAAQLGLLRKELSGSVRASGVVTGAMAAPRSSIELEAKSLAWGGHGGDTVLTARGDAVYSAGAFDIKAAGSALRFDPASFGAPIAGAISGDFDVSARSGSAWRAAIKLGLQASTLGAGPLRGSAKLVLEANHVTDLDIDLQAGTNTVNAKGAFGRAGEQLEWRLDASQLATLGPQYGGSLRGSGVLKGAWEAPSLAASLEGKGLMLQKQRLASASAVVNIGNDALVIDARLAGYDGAVKLANARLQTSGSPAAHTLRLGLGTDTFESSAELKGGWNGSSWTGMLAQLQNKGSYALALQAPAPLSIGVAPGAGLAGLLHPEQVRVSDLVLALPEGSIKLHALSREGQRWSSRGTANGLPLRYLTQGLPSMRETVYGNLVLGADWSLDLQGGDNPVLAGGIHLFRERGDILVGADVATSLGLTLLDARADFLHGSGQSNSLRVQLNVDGARNGSAKVDGTTELIEGRFANTSPITLNAEADLRSIAWLAPVLGQSAWDIDGSLKVSLRGSGTLGKPSLIGSVTGDNLALRWAEQGVKLKNGQLRTQLSGDQMLVQRLSFEGPQGTAVANGTVRFTEGDADVQLKLVADKLELLSRPDRTLVLSGTSTLVRDQKHFQLDGKFKADRARVELAPLDRPTLSDDVVVLGRDGTAPAKPAASTPLGIDLEADLGDDFVLKGMGLDARMAGVVRIRAVDRRAPRATGSIRVVNGTYYAYGKKLEIERGVLNFTGAYDNPGLNILAVRKQPEGEALSETNVEAGVEVRGSALAPLAKLVSTPNVPDSEKLAWLVLGHGMEGAAGQELGVLSAAAGALLGGGGSGFQSRLANTIGVDELGLAQAKGLESTVVTVGKRLSQRAYLSFEQGASTATSLVKLRYKLNPRVTLQFQTGANTALDVLYSWAFD
jgi:translocation and assembly module TamB